MIPVHDEKGITIYHGDCVDVMRSMPDNSVDSIVTDPPYGLSFMGKKWDYDVPSVEAWTEALRVLKPGGHLLAFGGSRTYHRVVVNIEDAGFEIRDQIMWIYGSGFPKSLDVSKAIDKAAGVEREVVGVDETKIRKDGSEGFSMQRHQGQNGTITAPATEAAQQWDGWGTALKPAHEPICVARKPITGTVAENVLKYGTGGINIDGGRIGTEERTYKGMSKKQPDGAGTFRDDDWQPKDVELNATGRFPANIILDPYAGAMLDKQSGDTGNGYRKNPSSNKTTWFGDKTGKHIEGERGHNDSGGASRFFYCAKASKQDRDEGLEGMPLGEPPASARSKPAEGRQNALGNPRANHHPTVKPTALMQYLVRLVTPPGGTVADFFMGSGSTGKAAVREGFKFIGCEREAEYIPISIARINAPAQVELI